MRSSSRLLRGAEVRFHSDSGTDLRERRLGRMCGEDEDEAAGELRPLEVGDVADGDSSRRWRSFLRKRAAVGLGLSAGAAANWVWVGEGGGQDGPASGLALAMAMGWDWDWGGGWGGAGAGSGCSVATAPRNLRTPFMTAMGPSSSPWESWWSFC